jgi:dTDP-4-dehydrorhamnose 3,5-epimerase-like enzyme
MEKIQNDFPIFDKIKIVDSEIKKQNYGIGIIFDERIYNFVAKRIFYIYDVNPSMNRGNHANIKTTMCFAVLKGHCKIVIDDGQKKEAFVLDEYNKILICSPMTWKEMSDFSSDCILMVICDTYFDANDYIDDYNIFKEICLGGLKK